MLFKMDAGRKREWRSNEVNQSVLKIRAQRLQLVRNSQ